MMYAQIVEGEVDWSEVFLILAVVLFIVGGALRWRVNEVAGALLALGLALFAFAFILL